MREGELAQALDDIWAKSSTRNWILGRLGVFNGTEAAIDVVGRPGYVVVSMGDNGDLGITVAKDKVGVAKVVFQAIKMRRENGELVIREAAAYAGGSGGGGDGTLDALSDVVLSSIADGQVLTYSTEIGQWRNEAGGAGTGMVVHALSGPYHNDLLNWAQINFMGSDLADLSARDHGDLTGIGPNQHHQQVHAITGTDHTIVGSPFQVVGAVATDTLGLLTPTHNPGETERLLKTDASGSLALDSTLLVVDAAANVVSVDSDLFVVNGPADKVTIKTNFFVADPGASRLTIDTNLLYVDAANNWVGINRQPAGAALDIIASAIADHSIRIKQKEGQINRLWRLESFETLATHGVEPRELIVIDSVGNLQSGSPGFVSGLTGWQITPGGNAEFNNIWARGELHATVFVKDEVHATGGTLLVATAGKLHSDGQIDAATVDQDELDVQSDNLGYPAIVSVPLDIVTTSAAFSGTTLTVVAIGNMIEIDDPPSGPGLYFQPGEIIRVKTEINEEGNPLRLSDLWMEVMQGYQEDGYSRYSVMKRSGSDCTIPAGTAVVSYGQRGDGRILMTSDWRSDEGYTPYIDVFTTGQNPWDANDPAAIIPRMRMGQLKGVGVPGTTVPGPGDGIVGVTGVPQYGIIAGSDLTNANTGYLIASNLGIRLHKVPLTLNNGTADTGKWLADGNLRIGSNVAQDDTTGFQFDPTTGNLIIGNVGLGHFLRWTQATHTLTVSGSLVVQDPGTTVTKTYVDQQDSYYSGVAQGFANTAQTTSINYGNNRRIAKVTGTWRNDLGANRIDWSGVQITFYNGAIATVTNGFANFAQRLYVYVDLAAVGTLTFLGFYAANAISDPNLVLIAVFDVGANGDPKASVTVVAGSTYISGGSIFTNSIYAGHIVAQQITAGHLEASTIAVINNAAGTAKTDAQAYGNRRRVVGVSQSWAYGSQNTNVISWTGMVVRFADGSSQNVNNNSAVINVNFVTTYLYVYVGTPTGNLSMAATTSIYDIGPDHVLIATVRPAVHTASGGSGWPTLMVVAGGTYISGDAIVTGSIVAQNIATDTITADKMNVSDLNAITVGSVDLNVTGNLVVGNTGKIYSAAKTSYASTVAGFFLGYDVGYKFNIGDANAYLKWDGANLLLRTNTPIIFRADVANNIFYFQDYAGASTTTLAYQWIAGDGRGQMSTGVGFRSDYRLEAPSITLTDAFGGSNHEVIVFNFTGSPASRRSMGFNSATSLLSYDGDFSTSSSLFCQYFVVQGNRMVIRIRRDVNTSTPGGEIGELCWGWNSNSATWNLFAYLPGGSPGPPDNPGWYRVGMTRI